MYFQSISRWLVVAAVGISLRASLSRAEYGKECATNRECPLGATCVAGDAVQSIQRCVAGVPCGGAQSGGCPGDPGVGQLACIWRPDPHTCATARGGCAEMNGELGIYKCLSLDRCDKYLGNGACSGSCNVDGKQCNGRGSCQLIDHSGTSPVFQCACETGWNGTRCENVVNDKCITDVGQCGEHGSCVDNACVCSNGYSGVQCEIAPSSSSISGSGSKANISARGSYAGSTIGSTGSWLLGSSSSSGPHYSLTYGSRLSAGESSSQERSNTTASKKKSSGPSALAIVFACLAGVIVLVLIAFVIYARKRRQAQEAEDNDSFSRVDSTIDPAAAAAPATPKGKIVIM